MKKLLSLAILPGALSSCILLLGDRPSSEEHCSFQGELYNLCHNCIAEECQVEVDACCGDDACSRDLMPSLDACATEGKGSACTALLAVPADTSQSSVLSACVEQRCGERCVAGK